MLSTNMEAQTTNKTVAGEYYLKAVREMASGFKLNADSTFEFFFSYGALDRGGSGNYYQTDGKILFISKPGSEGFALNNSSKVNEGKVTIKIIEPNSIFRSHVQALLKSGEKQSEEFSDNDGTISFPKQQVDSITLIFEFCPDKPFTFSNNNKDHNYFEFRFENDILDVIFNKLSFTLTEEGFEGQHPLLKKGIYHFEKN